MKTNLIKTFALVAALVGSSFAFAESWNVNDSVVIKKDVKHYLTGEEPSEWVYGKTFSIQQIGSKRFENGILLREIISWVGPEDITRPDGSSASAEPAGRGNAKRQQNAGPDKNADKKYDFGDWKVGDTIMIKRSTTRYLTGEEPSKWVYDRKHTIQTLGSKRFPEGVLVAGIISWVGPNDIYRPSDQPARESKIETKPAKPADQGKKEEVKPVDQGKKEEVKPADQGKKEEVKPADQGKKEEVKPADQGKKEEVKPATDEGKKTEKPQAAQRAVRMQPHHRFSIGVRGGVASLMHKAPVMNNWKAGFDALLDLQYAYYFGAKEGKKVNHGIITGLSFGYAQSPIKNGVNYSDTKNITDESGSYSVNYNIAASEVKSRDGELQIEVPLMYSLQTEKGFFFNVGPKFMMPVWTRYNQTISADHNISAKFTDLGVTVPNEVVTGVIGAGDVKKSGSWGANQAKISLLLAAELGWEWELKNGHALGLGVYGSYAPLNTYKPQNTNLDLVTVKADGTGAADVTVNSATDSYTTGMNYFDAGLKLIYHFQFPAKK